MPLLSTERFALSWLIALIFENLVRVNSEPAGAANWETRIEISEEGFTTSPTRPLISFESGKTYL